MAVSPKNKRDKAWLGWFVIQIIIIFRTPHSFLTSRPSLSHVRHAFSALHR